MLVLTRKYQEKIRIGDNITITVLRTKGKAVRLGIEAPTNVPVIRGELSFEHESEAAAEAGRDGFVRMSKRRRPREASGLRMGGPISPTAARWATLAGRRAEGQPESRVAQQGCRIDAEARLGRRTAAGDDGPRHARDSGFRGVDTPCLQADRYVCPTGYRAAI